VDIPLDPAVIDQIRTQAHNYFFQQVLSWTMAAQIAAASLALLLAYKATKTMRSWFSRLQEKVAPLPESSADLSKLMTFVRVIDSFLAASFVAIAYGCAEHYHWPSSGLYTFGIILVALTLVRLLTEGMKNRLWAGILVGVIWLWAFLYIFHIIAPVHHLLRHIVFNFGKVQLSLFTISRGFLLLLGLYWVARNLQVAWRFWLTVESGLTSSVQILIYKLGSIFLYVVSAILVLHYMGLDLTIFALFSGALAFGLGFGLQKVFANLVSGFIILADKSIKPGDVIQLGDKYGWINFLGSRYTSVIARNGTEHLIPNEKLVTGEVINWSYSNNFVRIDLPVGVSYASDLEKARDLMLEAAASSPRVLKDPRPSCLLAGFGDSAVNLKLRVWLNDPQNGVSSLQSDLLWGIWDRFREHGIELPFPQRDVHLKSVSQVGLGPGAVE
jgi:small-conductance mechanosensitive channel